MRCWVDADACPGVIKDVIIRAVSRLRVPTTFVANQPINGLPDSELFEAVQVEAGPDVADDYIAERMSTGDLVITQDIPLAAQVLAKDGMAISPHGQVFDKANISSRLATRNLLQEKRDAGEITGGPKPFTPKDKERFANSLDKWLTRLKKEAEI